MSRRNSAFRASIGGFFFGGVVGLGLGLLIAPDEGKQMRQRVKYLLERWGEQLAQRVGELRSDDVASAAREKAESVIADAREQAEQILGEAEALMAEARQRRSGERPLRRAS